MEQTVQTRSCGLLQLGGVAGWEFWWIGGELGSQQYVVWRVANSVDGLPVACHSELRWVQLGCFGTDEIASCVWQFDEIESSSGQRVAHCRGAQCMRYLTQEDEDTCRDELRRSRVD
jgi:hypothetical protein